MSFLEAFNEILAEQERPLDQANSLDGLVRRAQIPGDRSHTADAGRSRGNQSGHGRPDGGFPLERDIPLLGDLAQ